MLRPPGPASRQPAARPPGTHHPLRVIPAAIGRRIQPSGGPVAAVSAQFLAAVAFWWWSLHCLLCGQVPWRRLFLSEPPLGVDRLAGSATVHWLESLATGRC